MMVKTNVLAALLGVLGGGFLLTDPAPGPAAAELKIGFVDMFKVRSASKHVDALVKKFEEDMNREQKAILERQETLKKQLREELPLYEEGSPEFEKLRLDLQIKEHRLKLEKQQLLNKIKRGELRVWEDFMTRLQQVVGEWGGKNGYSAVLLERPVNQVRSSDDLMAAVNQWVLYRDKALDVTDEIIKVFDQP